MTDISELVRRVSKHHDLHPDQWRFTAEKEKTPSSFYPRAPSLHPLFSFRGYYKTEENKKDPDFLMFTIEGLCMTGIMCSTASMDNIPLEDCEDQQVLCRMAVTMYKKKQAGIAKNFAAILKQKLDLIGA